MGALPHVVGRAPELAQVLRHPGPEIPGFPYRYPSLESGPAPVITEDREIDNRLGSHGLSPRLGASSHYPEAGERDTEVRRTEDFLMGPDTP
jgi:hypothetical protein